MARNRCESCGGIYNDIGRDGVPYFHACPPLTVARVTRDGVDQQVEVRALLPTDTVTVQRPGGRVRVLVSEMQNGDARLGDDTVPRADARDENTARKGGEREGDRIIKRRGLGATKIGDSPPVDA